MKKDRLERWLQNIYQTRDEEISCSECFDLVSQYVDVELSGEDAARQMPQLTHHLKQCAACREEYETLRDLARLDKDGKLPSADDPGDSPS